MKKVVIITYFFPPCNLTASQRSLGWARYLKKEGFQPIIITRNWEHHINGPDDMHHDSGKELVHEINPDYEVYYLPFRGNLRDRLYSKYGKNKYNFFRKMLSFIELFGHSFTNKAIPFSNIYDFTAQYIEQHKDIKAFIISGNPFEIFRFGYLLNKKFSLPWIADYRDDWNTSEVNYSRGFLDGILKKMQQQDEKKWVKTAHCITSISPYYAQKIGKYVQKEGHVLLNGFFEEDVNQYTNEELFGKFTIVYNGMLYPSQQIEVFLEAFKQFINAQGANRNKIILRFPGILFLKEVAARVSQLMKGYEDVLEMTERISRDEILKIQAKSHLLLMVAHKGTKGIPSSKIYEYLGLRRPVMICPSDNDILEQTFSAYNLGYIAHNEKEAVAQLTQLFNAYLHPGDITIKANEQYVNQFSRKHQTTVLADILRNM
jgi:glycosyltransferase involved in cell wall biosynthesis